MFVSFSIHMVRVVSLIVVPCGFHRGKYHTAGHLHTPEVVSYCIAADKARAMLASRGIYCEHTTAANYAAYLAYVEKYGPTPDCLITMCGAGLKSDH